MHTLDHPTPQMVECSRLQLRETQLRRRREDIELLLRCTPRHDAPAFAVELPRRLPQEVWLDRLQIGPGSKCLVEGTTQATDAVFALGEALRGSPYVESVRITESGGHQDGGVILTRFTLEALLASLDRPPKGRQ
jgi:Tfp pilus assembly protein PilN